MFGKKKSELESGQEKETVTPKFMNVDYPYKAVENELDIDVCQDSLVYEIKCHTCEMSIRSQGQNIRPIYKRLLSSGCVGCGNKDLKIYILDMSKSLS